VGFNLKEKTIKESFEYLKQRSDKAEGISFNDLIVILTIQKKNEDIEYALINAFNILGFGNLEKVNSEAFQDLLTYKGYR
jgi:Ca2+-binding EF-hand superfamily protein